MQPLTHLHSLVVAQANADGALGVLGNLPPFILMFGVLYFVLIRPNNKERQLEQQMLAALKKDDEIVTKGGLCARIVALDEHVVTLEIADRIKVKMLRKSVAGLWQPEAAASSTRKT